MFLLNMTTTKQKNNLNNILELKKAWIVRWVSYSASGERILNELGLTADLVFDFLGARPSHDEHVPEYVREYAENIYKQNMLSLSRKFALAHRHRQKAKKEEFGRITHLSSPYQSECYKKMNESCENNGDNSDECINLKEKWKDLVKNPRLSIAIGDNPVIEIKKVFNLELEVGSSVTMLSWDEPLGNGTCRHCKQKTGDLFH